MNPSKVATNAITLTETMEALCVKIENTFSQGKENENLACLYTSKSIYHFKNCGTALFPLLKEFKEHGYSTKEFDEYVEEKFGIKPRMRQRYVQLATNERTKDADESFFIKMISPTLTNVVKALSFSDADWEKVINGDDTPFEFEIKATDEEVKTPTQDDDKATDEEVKTPIQDDDKATDEEVKTPTQDDNNATDEEVKFINEYPELFSDDEYRDILNMSRELLILQLVNERKMIKAFESEIEPKKISLLSFGLPESQKEVA